MARLGLTVSVESTDRAKKFHVKMSLSSSGKNLFKLGAKPANSQKRK
jgi:hypothetical protein